MGPLLRLVGERQPIATVCRVRRARQQRVEVHGRGVQRGAQFRVAPVLHALCIKRDDGQDTTTRTILAKPFQEPQALVRELLRDIGQQHDLVGQGTGGMRGVVCRPSGRLVVEPMLN